MDQIIEYARIRTLVVARFRLSDLLTKVLTLLRQPLQVKHLMVHTNFLPSADSLQADRNQIAQVLQTVIGHSIEASRRGVLGATPSGSRTCWTGSANSGLLYSIGTTREGPSRWTELASRPLRQIHSRSFIKDE